MTNDFASLDRQISQVSQQLRDEKDGDRLLVLSAELEQLFARKDLIQQERNKLYREHLRAS
jgi:hypothetical protein